MLIFPIEFNDFLRFGDRFWEAKSTKNRLKNGFQDSMPKFNLFWPGNRAQNPSKTPPRRSHDAPRRPKTPPRRPKMTPKRPKCRPGRLTRRSQDSPRTALEPRTDGVFHFWLHGPMGYPIFGGCLDPFWYQLRAILVHFGVLIGFRFQHEKEQDLPEELKRLKRKMSAPTHCRGRDKNWKSKGSEI